MSEAFNYGPLQGLIGNWYGDRGLDMAPERDGLDENPYYENLVFTPVGDVENAESQTLVGLHYIQVVQRKSDDKVFHHETGYWLWHEAEDVIMHSLAIPRAVGLLAVGSHTLEADGAVRLSVATKRDKPQRSIVQSAFMFDNAKTSYFEQVLTVKQDILHYSEATSVEVYDERFVHTDENTLTKKSHR